MRQDQAATLTHRLRCEQITSGKVGMQTCTTTMQHLPKSATMQALPSPHDAHACCTCSVGAVAAVVYLPVAGAGADGGLESAEKRPENAGPAQQQQQQAAHKTRHVTLCMCRAAPATRQASVVRWSYHQHAADVLVKAASLLALHPGRHAHDSTAGQTHQACSLVAAQVQRSAFLLAAPGGRLEICPFCSGSVRCGEYSSGRCLMRSGYGLAAAAGWQGRGMLVLMLSTAALLIERTHACNKHAL
jgi:hypothetical protein